MSAKNRTDIMVNNGTRKYFYDSKNGILQIFTLSGKKHNTVTVDNASWEENPAEWDKMINEIRSKDYQMSEAELEEMADALSKATDWKQAAIEKRNRNKNKL